LSSDDAGQLRLSFIEVENAGEIWIYAVLVSSLGSEILSVSQLYREIPIINAKRSLAGVAASRSTNFPRRTHDRDNHRRPRSPSPRLQGAHPHCGLLRQAAEQLTPLERWSILSETVKKVLRARLLIPPRHLLPAGAASYRSGRL
jgi:hypothetical protein